MAKIGINERRRMNGLICEAIEDKSKSIMSEPTTEQVGKMREQMIAFLGIKSDVTKLASLRAQAKKLDESLAKRVEAYYRPRTERNQPITRRRYCCNCLDFEEVIGDLSYTAAKDELKATEKINQLREKRRELLLDVEQAQTDDAMQKVIEKLKSIDQTPTYSARKRKKN